MAMSNSKEHLFFLLRQTKKFDADEIPEKASERSMEEMIFQQGGKLSNPQDITLLG